MTHYHRNLSIHYLYRMYLPSACSPLSIHSHVCNNPNCNILWYVHNPNWTDICHSISRNVSIDALLDCNSVIDIRNCSRKNRYRTSDLVSRRLALRILQYCNRRSSVYSHNSNHIIRFIITFLNLLIVMIVAFNMVNLISTFLYIKLYSTTGL